ncbi:MAG: anthrone oxygenase family protein [Pseudolysinimonas sp.]
MSALVISTIGVLFAGLLAGEEFIVRYGVQPALTSLDDLPHLRARQALVRRLRIVVPALMAPTVLLAIAALVVGGTAPGFAFRVAGLAALVAFVLFSFLGTVPINIRVNDWDAEHPPADWKRVIARWQLIDVFRSSAAILGFGLLLIGLVLQAS